MIEARDKWLKSDGILLPDKCTLKIAAIEEEQGRNSRKYWHHVYDFDMSAMFQAVNTKPAIMNIKANQVKFDKII